MTSCSAVLACGVVLLGYSYSGAVVAFDWAHVGDAGNAADPEIGLGAVSYNYAIAKNEVTNAQYTAFLNAVDPAGANTLALYHPDMAGVFGGIDSGGVTDGARYLAQPGREQNPVTFISFFDAMRFTNWLHNGQGGGDTETGTYTIGSGTNEVRSANAAYWIPSEDEWYKAAFYDPAGFYYDYPTGTDTAPYSDKPGSLNTPDDTSVANFFKNDSVPNG